MLRGKTRERKKKKVGRRCAKHCLQTSSEGIQTQSKMGATTNKVDESVSPSFVALLRDGWMLDG